ncbi:hypothetical protein A7U60_g3353 [Sanghuangporus baumii]|uniref:Uncharacterized protein n=1 Tax=Sanghuangporus baumii TaxID=108892 RepID=A0A9Q5N9Y9_SANBA|nr:hypothetical protein A7U60_g3353 [Sanghuangporus baumii]
MAAVATTISASALDISDNEDIAPEAIALSDSKRHVKRLNEIQQTAEDDAKRRRKERNRRRDENLKKRAQETRGDDKNRNERRLQIEKTNENEVEEDRNLEARMQRAMQEADAEQEQGDEKESWGNFEDKQDIEVGVGTDSDSDSSVHPSEGNGPSSDESMCGIEEEGMGGGPSDAGPSDDPELDYLPDHLFSEALSKKAATQPKKNSSLDEQSLQTKSNQKRKPAKKRKTKDIVLGSKTIRTISSKSSSVSLATYGTLPPGKIKRFYESHLNLRSNHASSKRGSSWDRKAANIGVLRSSSTSPAAHFVRSS